LAAPVGGELYKLKTLFCMGYIRRIASGNRDTNGVAPAVTDPMQFGIQPAFGQPYRPPVAAALLTPLAAIRWVLTWVASIIGVRKSAFSCANALNIFSKTPASAQRL